MVTSNTSSMSDAATKAQVSQVRGDWKYEYAAKIVCGFQSDPKDMRLARGFYGTAINIHNPNPKRVKFFKKLALTFPPDKQAPGRVMPIGNDRLKYDEALEVDCIDIQRRLFPNGFPPPGYIKGFLIIQSNESLDVTAVYTTASLDKQGNVSNHSGIDVEQICERRIVSRLGSACDVGGTIYFLDTFSTGMLSSGYNWFNEVVPPEGPSPNDDKYTLVDGHLRIEANKRQDLWGGGAKKGAPLMLRTAPTGDYCVETFVKANPAASTGQPSQPLNTQIGLFVFQDINNWIFFGLTNHKFTLDDGTHQGDGLMVTKTQGGASSPVPISGAPDPAYPVRHLTEDFVYLRIIRMDNDWEFYWKLHHDNPWDLLTTTNLDLAGHEVGMGVKTFDIAPSGDENEGQANFDFLLIGQ